MKLGLLSLIFIWAFNNAAGQSKEIGKDAAGILRETMKVLGNLTTVEYEVETNEERTLFSYKMAKVRAKTKILVAVTPLRAVARLQAEDGATYEMLTLNDKIMKFSVAGSVGESDLSKGFKPLVAYGDFNNTWKLLLDRGFFAEIVESGRILYGGQESVGNELCNVIIHATSNPQRNIIATNYYWISTKTNLPRAYQVLLMDKRGASLQSRRLITITKQDPPITPATFAYIPTEKDSVAPPMLTAKTDESETVADRELTEWNGKPLPTLIADDLTLKKTNFVAAIDKPTLITFWATWCGPCLKEMPSFQKMLEKYQGKFQVLAIAVMDQNRASTVEFIKKHPEYKFTFLLDPDWERKDSPIKTALGINALPINLLADANGRIVSAYLGERKEAEWAELIDKLVKKAGFKN